MPRTRRGIDPRGGTGFPEDPPEGGLGAHLSIAGGVAQVFARGEELGCTAIQMFVKNNNRWRGTPLDDHQVEAFAREQARTAIWPVWAHNTYLVNLASPDPGVRERSVACTVDELQRCERLGLPWLVLHPGAHLGAGPARGIARVAANLLRVFERTPRVRTRVLLETTAGQGTLLGRSAQELAALLQAVDVPERMGVCLDSCHMFAAGYELRTEQGYSETMRIFDEALGLEQVRVIHLNDSLKPLGSRRDRHADIGLGEIGDRGFRRLMRDPRLAAVPKVLETPKENDGDRRNLARLRRLAGND
jgi:deoxyribonuclease IV